jgi:hypothetical protein
MKKKLQLIIDTLKCNCINFKILHVEHAMFSTSIKIVLKMCDLQKNCTLIEKKLMKYDFVYKITMQINSIGLIENQCIINRTCTIECAW